MGTVCLGESGDRTPRPLRASCTSVGHPSWDDHSVVPGPSSMGSPVWEANSFPICQMGVKAEGSPGEAMGGRSPTRSVPHPWSLGLGHTTSDFRLSPATMARCPGAGTRHWARGHDSPCKPHTLSHTAVWVPSLPWRPAPEAVAGAGPHWSSQGRRDAQP